MGLGFDKIKMTPQSRSITNLVNITSSQGTFGKSDTTIARVLKVAIAVLIYVVIEGLFVRVFPWYISILLWILGIYPLLRGISIFIFNEKSVKRDYELRDDPNKMVDSSMYWSIYDIADKRPYTLSYMDGELALVYLAIRSSSIGDGDKWGYKHYNALTEMYNMAKPWGIKVTVLDVQSTEVRDVRMDELYANLNDVSDVILEKVLADLYKHLDDFSYNSRLSYEYFVFSGKCSEQTLHENVAYLISTANNGNYRGFKNLNQMELENLTMNLFGIENVEIKEMLDLIAEKANTKAIRFLWVANKEGKRKILNEPISGVHTVEQYEYEVEEENKVDLPESGEGQDVLLDIFTDDADVSEQDTFTQVLRNESKVENVDTVDLFGGEPQVEESKKTSKKAAKKATKKTSKKDKEIDENEEISLF